MKFDPNFITAEKKRRPGDRAYERMQNGEDRGVQQEGTEQNTDPMWAANKNNDQCN